MPLVACPDCRREVSDTAPTCPGCGRPMTARETGVHASKRVVWLRTLALVGCIAGTISTCGGATAHASGMVSVGIVLLVVGFGCWLVGRVLEA